MWTSDGSREPIAIIGMSCRFAGGVSSPDELWSFLAQGRSAVGSIPEHRWSAYLSADPVNARVLRQATRFGSFLDDISLFDPGFFGISPREAERMDPQQRMLLELAWEALEHAGVPPDSLAGGDTGVYMGVGSDDYGRRMLEDLPSIEARTGIGAAYCAVPNRISYCLDLRGASVAVDTACSSSLVAIHLACQGLRLGEVPLAIAGGVLVIAGPGLTLVLDRAGATSPDGRCKSFDAAADGYGRGEGGGVVVLKRLSDALRDGDRVLALVRGTAVHQDGRTNGIMAPSGSAQEHLLRRAYQRAGLSPSTVDYVEAHGTGTRIGDPMEAGALARVFGAGRPAGQRCLIGSVKTNIGHVEAGAGVAGVIKTVLALRHGQIPASLNFHTPNPEIDWAGSGLEVVTQLRPWPEHAGPRRAAVSGFGYGGTIAHVILEEPVEKPSRRDRPAAGRQRPANGVTLFPISSGSAPGLAALAGRLADRLDEADAGLDGVGHTLAHRRTHLAYRAAVVAGGRRELVAGLRALAAGEAVHAGRSGMSRELAAAGPAMVFSGHGAQWIGMGRELLDSEPAFAGVLAQLEPVFTAEVGFSPRAELLGDGFTTVDRIQPLIFAVQVGLAAVWRAYGVEPAAVIGHSVGEIAAAVVAGICDLAAGGLLVCRRSVLLRRVAGRGGMAMVGLGKEDVQRRLAGRHDVVVAISSSPVSTVISGDTAAIAELAEHWRSEGLPVRRVDSDVAFHSGQMDPLLDDLVSALAGLTPKPPDIRVYSTAVDDPRTTCNRDGAYWAANLRNEVRLADAVRAAAEDGYRLFIEVSAHPVVAHSLAETLDAAGVAEALVVPSLRRRQPERATLLANLAAVFSAGVDLNWSALQPAGGLVDLPTTAWQHASHWFDPAGGRPRVPVHHDPDGHTLLGGYSSAHANTPVDLWHTLLDRSTRPYPGDHPVRDVEIVPAAVLLNTFMATGRHGGLADVTLRTPVVVEPAREIQVVRQEGSVHLNSRLMDPGGGAWWLTHTTANLVPAAGRPDRILDLPALWAAHAEPLPEASVVDRLREVGVAAMGFPWRIERLGRRVGSLLAQVSVDPPATTWAPVLDAALSVGSVAFAGPQALRMPAAIREVAVHGPPPSAAVIQVRLADGAADTVDVEVVEPSGQVQAWLAGLRYGLLDAAPGTRHDPRSLVYEPRWQDITPEPRAQSACQRVLVVGDQGLARALGSAWSGDEVTVTHLSTPDTLAGHQDLVERGTAVVVAPSPAVEQCSPSWLLSTWLLLSTAHVLAARNAPGRPLLWAVTRGVAEAHDPAALAHAPLWALGRVLGSEYPQLWGGSIDLSCRYSVSESRALLETLRTVRDEDVIRVRGADRHVMRLATVQREEIRSDLECRPDGTYLITGGLGVLGLRVARWLAGRGARRLVLLGRTALPPRDRWDGRAGAVPPVVRAVQALEARGVTVRTLAVDVTDRVGVGNRLAALDLPPVRGVVHAAGVLENRLAGDVDLASLLRVMDPKVRGALTLHELFPPGSVDFLVLFSSAGLLLGLPGQASYASANAFLDALARYRRSTGHRDTISLGFTSWRGLGMSTSSALVDAELHVRGTADITQAEAFEAWDFAQRRGLEHAAVLRIIASGPRTRTVPLLSEIEAPEPDAVADTAAGGAQDDNGWASLPSGELLEYLTGQVREHAAAELRLPVIDLDPHRPLADLGLDSLMTAAIRQRLQRQLRLRLPATLLWNHPTVAAVGRYLLEQVSEGERP